MLNWELTDLVWGKSRKQLSSTVTFLWRCIFHLKKKSDICSPFHNIYWIHLKNKIGFPPPQKYLSNTDTSRRYTLLITWMWRPSASQITCHAVTLWAHRARRGEAEVRPANTHSRNSSLLPAHVVPAWPSLAYCVIRHIWFLFFYTSSFSSSYWWLENTPKIASYFPSWSKSALTARELASD